jgi:hypothetical protein
MEESTMKRSCVGILLYLILVLLCNPFLSTGLCDSNNQGEIIDQSNEFVQGGNGIWYRYIAQEFVPTSSLLSKIEVALTANENAHYPVKISIRKNVFSKDIVSTEISSESISHYPEVRWIEFDFDDLQVEPGKTYYIIVAPTYGSRFFQQVPKSEHVYWMVTWDNNYTNGTSYISKSQRFLWPFDYLSYNHHIDFCFRTYTKTNPCYRFPSTQ